MRGTARRGCSMRVLNGGIDLNGNGGERRFGPDGRPLGSDGCILSRTTPLGDWSTREPQKVPILVAAPRLGAARSAPTPRRDKGKTTELYAAELELRRFQRRVDKKVRRGPEQDR